MTKKVAAQPVIPHHTFEQDDVLEKEKEHLGIQDPGAASGLAISGGGIRSASFGLGVMQALVFNNVLERIDYMSTVSGGGYLGSALTWALKQGGAAAGTTPENFPLGTRVDPQSKEKVSFRERNKLLNFIRQHATYLTPTRALDMLSFIPVVLRSMTISLAVYLGFFSVTMTLLVSALYNLTGLSKGLWGVTIPPQGVLLIVGGVLLAVMVLIAFPYSLSTFTKLGKNAHFRYKVSISHQIVAGLMLKISLVCFILGSLPFTLRLIEGSLAIPTGSTVFGAVVGLWQYMKAHKKDTSTGIKSDILIYLGVFCLFYGVLLLAYALSTMYFLDETTYRLAHPVVFAIAVVSTLILGYFTNLNLIGPHNLWRSRLMEAFMPNKDAVQKNQWQRADEADPALMEDMCDEKNRKPYHIINTNLILPNSRQVDYSGRGGDNFILSPLYCGSRATGWKETKYYHKGNGRGITLATAMATSAAALNPNAAVSGEGMTRNVMISLLLSMLNLRLGTWISNPGIEKEPMGPPNFLMPGLWSEILRQGMHEKSRHIQLSDGGHYENLALYELIRRKLGLIIVSDGGADAAFNFDDLANVVEKARVDFGAKVSFIKDHMLDIVLPGTAGESQYQKKYSIAKQGFAVARITYADGSLGILYYLKLAMIQDLSTDVFSYKGVNPSFPHQSTSDQFFDEKQFEAYRELGYYVAWQMMDSPFLKERFKAPKEKAEWLADLRCAFDPPTGNEQVEDE